MIYESHFVSMEVDPREEMRMKTSAKKKNTSASSYSVVAKGSSNS